MTGRLGAGAVAGGLLVGLLATGCSDEVAKGMTDSPMMVSAFRTGPQGGPDGSSTWPCEPLRGPGAGGTGPMAGGMHGMYGRHGMAPMGGVGGMGAPGPMSSMHVASEADYLVDMVAHHQEAVAAARELERSDRAELREFGRRIVRDQSAQIELMEGWLDAWYPDTPRASDYVPMMSDLSGLEGDRLDLTFLSEMVHHHMMAVMMSRQLQRLDLVEHSQVGGLARVVVRDQTAEIVEMRGWLRAWS